MAVKGGRPALDNQGLLDAVTDGFLQATICSRPARYRHARVWAGRWVRLRRLSPEEINDIVAFIHAGTTTPLPKEGS
ncbi:MAG: hypothetical protein R3B72_21470 [Polyangiaceae bacterium]